MRRLWTAFVLCVCGGFLSACGVGMEPGQLGLDRADRWGNTHKVRLEGMDRVLDPGSIPLSVSVGTSRVGSIAIKQLPKAAGPCTGCVVTVAGGGVQRGYKDGLGASARFAQPKGIAIDGQGYLYVIDAQNLRIRKISPKGQVTTWGAAFKRGEKIAVDRAGHVYLTDHRGGRNYEVHKIDAAGHSSRLASSCTYFPGLGVDPHDNVYLLDHGQVRAFDKAGHAKPAIGGYSRGSMYAAVVGDDRGNLYLADSWRHQIRKIDAKGQNTTFAGSFQAGDDDGAGTQARFDAPQELIRDAKGQLYVVDKNRSRIRKIDASGKVTTLVSFSPGYRDGSLKQAASGPIGGIAVDANGHLYFTDTTHHRIRKIIP